MTDELMPVPDAVRALPSPRDISAALMAELQGRVERERLARGDVHQPEDVYPLVRSLAGARDLLQDYARVFSSAAGLAGTMLEEEHLTAVGENDGVPLAGLKVPDLDGTDIQFTLSKPNSHDIDQRTVIAAVVARTVALMAGGEPVQETDESDTDYATRYWRWFAHVIERAIDWVLELGSYTMQVSKVRAFAAALAGDGEDGMSAVVTSAVKTTPQYRGVKVERKQRRKP